MLMLNVHQLTFAITHLLWYYVNDVTYRIRNETSLQQLYKNQSKKPERTILQKLRKTKHKHTRSCSKLLEVFKLRVHSTLSIILFES